MTWPQGSRTCRCGAADNDGGRPTLAPAIGENCWGSEVRRGNRYDPNDYGVAVLVAVRHRRTFERNDLVTSRQNPANPPASLFLENGPDLANP